MTRLTFGALGVMLWTCTVDVNSIAPFPVALDGTCPQGLYPEGGWCGVACTGVSSDCPAGLDCSTFGQKGVCVPKCDSDHPCDSAHTCGPAYAHGPTVCLPAGTSMLSACVSVAAEATCVRCGTNQASQVACGAASCPANSTCSSNTGCECAPGFEATNCDGAACSMANCDSDSWWCKPTSPLPVGCNEHSQASAGTCHCRDGRTAALICGDPRDCEQLCAESNCASDGGNCSGGFILVGGMTTIQGGAPSAGGIQVVSGGLDFLQPACGSGLCVYGGIKP